MALIEKAATHFGDVQGSEDYPIGVTEMVVIVRKLKPSFDDFSAQPQVTIAMALKNPGFTRGKILCTSGRVAESKTVKDLVEGSIVNTSLEIVRFVAIGFAGSIGVGSRAVFCGAFVGRYSYKNLGGQNEVAALAAGMLKVAGNH